MQAGDDLAVVHQPGHGVTVSTMFRALTTDRSLLPELRRVDNLARRGAGASVEPVRGLSQLRWNSHN